jgi:hypothetical protein
MQISGNYRLTATFCSAAAIKYQILLSDTAVFRELQHLHWGNTVHLFLLIHSTTYSTWSSLDHIQKLEQQSD